MSTLASQSTLTTSDTKETVTAGLIGGLVGGVIIWIYEAIVWVGNTKPDADGGIPRNATGLVFGKGVQESLGAMAYVVGTGIHFFLLLRLGRAVRLHLAVLPPVAATRRRSSPCSLRSFCGS